MNTILLTDEIVTKDLDKSIIFEYCDGFIPRINITFLKDCELEIKINTLEKKYQINYHIDNVDIIIKEIKSEKIKILNKYNIVNSKVELIKISDCNEIRMNDIVNLDNSKIKYINKTVATGLEKYNLDLHHNSDNCESLIINNGINYSGTIDFNISAFVLSGNKNCITNQNNRIINLVDKKCVIRPNLFIYEYDCFAEHAALIDNFRDDELFYLQRMGITKEEGKKILLKGFICDNISDELSQVFKKYWR